MNTIVKILLSTAMLVTANTYAELTLDTKYLGLGKEFSQLGWDESKPVDAFMKKEEEKIKADLTSSGEILPPSPTFSASLVTWGAYGHAHAFFNGREYYLRAFNYPTAEQHRRNRADIHSKVIPGGGACVLYVSDKDLNKVASLKIDLPENNHGTWCNGVKGIGAAGKGRDGVLIPLSYYLTDNTPAKQAKDIGEGWRYMTVYIRFKEVEGKLTLSQDDRCLGNPNKYKDIPSARKALTRCESQ